MDNRERNKALIESNMLNGNINRIFITDDLEELERMYNFAKMRIDTIYKINKLRIIYKTK